MKKGFVQNSNYVRFLQAVKAVEQRGARESGILLVSGEPGLGKSRAVDKWAVDNKAVYFRAVENMKHGFLLKSLSLAMGIDFDERDGRGKRLYPAGATNAELQARLTGLIGQHQRPIVIDEAQKLLGSSTTLLEVIRDISDLTEVMVVYVAGVASFARDLAKHRQISSRIFREVPFDVQSEQDVALFCKQLAEIDIDRDLVAELHRQSGGVIRLVVNGINTIERIAKANGMKVATTDAFKGLELCANWEPRRVRTGGAR